MGVFVNDAVYSVDDNAAGVPVNRELGRPPVLINPRSFSLYLGDIDRELIDKILAARPDLANANGKGGQAAAVRWALSIAAAALESAE